MKQVSTIVILTVALMVFAGCDPTRALRVRRQGWQWVGNGGNGGSISPNFGGGGSNPNQWQPTQTTPTTNDLQDPGASTTTTASPAYTSCMARCLTTPQYNPVCGTNRVTYDNRAKLQCARSCGVAVDVLFIGTCAPVTR